MFLVFIFSDEKIIVETLLSQFVQTLKRKISIEIWGKIRQKLIDARLYRFTEPTEIEKYFWTHIFSRLESDFNVSAEVVDQIKYGKWLKIHDIRVVMRRDGESNRIPDDIYSEMELLVEYMRHDTYCRTRLERLKALTRKEYVINLDDPRLKLPNRVKNEMMTPESDVHSKPVEGPSAVEDPQLEVRSDPGVNQGSQRSQREPSLRKVGSATIFSVPVGMNVHIRTKEGVCEYVVIPDSQDRFMPNTQTLNEMPAERDSALEMPPLKRIFDPCVTSTQQNCPLSPIRFDPPPPAPPQLVSVSQNVLRNEENESFSMLSVSQNIPQSSSISAGFLMPESYKNPIEYQANFPIQSPQITTSDEDSSPVQPPEPFQIDENQEAPVQLRPTGSESVPSTETENTVIQEDKFDDINEREPTEDEYEMIRLMQEVEEKTWELYREETEYECAKTTEKVETIPVSLPSSPPPDDEGCTPTEPNMETRAPRNHKKYKRKNC